MAGESRGIAEEGTQIVGTAVLKEPPDPIERRCIERRSVLQARVVMSVAGCDRERDFLRARERLQLLDAIRPIVLAAEQPHDDQPRMSRDGVKIKIDGIGVLQLRQRRAAQARKSCGPLLIEPRQQTQLGIREGQKYDFGGRLPKVDCRAGVVETVEIAREKMHGASRQRQHRDDGVAIEALFADNHDTAHATFVGLPGAIEMMLDARPDALHEQAHRLADDFDETLDAQHVMGARRFGESRNERRRIIDGRKRHNEAVEVVMVMFRVDVMMRRTVRQIILRRCGKAEQHQRINPPSRGAHDLRTLPRALRQTIGDVAFFRGVEQIGLVEDDEIGAGELIFEHFFERIVVIDRLRLFAFLGDRIEIIGETSFRNGLAVDDGDDAVDRELGADRRPVERLDQRLRQREPGGLDDDVVGTLLMRQQRLDRRHEIVGDGATQATIGEFDDVLFGAVVDSAGAQNFTVDADVAEFINDERETSVLGVFEHMTNERGLTRAEKAGDDRCRNFPPLTRPPVPATAVARRVRQARPQAPS